MKVENGVLVSVDDRDIKNNQLVIPEGVTSIGRNALFGLSCYLTSVIIPEGVTSIGEKAFYNCRYLTAMVIPESVTSIGKEAFASCNNLTSIALPKGLAIIGDNAFSDCEKLAAIVIPEGVTAIGVNAFCGCYSLKSIVIPEGVISIGKDAFAACPNIISIEIPDSVMIIGQNAFSNFSRLSVIHIEAKTQESYDRIYSQLEEGIQEKIQNCHKTFEQKSITLLAAYNHGSSFFKGKNIPKEIIQNQLFMLAKEYGISPFMLKQTYQKFGIDTEAASINENRTNLGS